MNAYHGSSSDDEEYEGEDRNQQDCSSDDEQGHDQSHPRKLDHQLEWDDAAIEYGAKKV